MAPPLVSVLVTTYNDAPFVEECLDSLLGQTADFELIITDDASTDGTADLIEMWLRRTGHAARFLRNASNRGICANRNTALALATGRFVSSLAGDDAYEPARLEEQSQFFLGLPDDVAAVYSDMRQVDASGRDLGPTYLEEVLGDEPPPEGAIFDRLLLGNVVPAPATMLRRSAIDAVGGYDETLAYEDYDMWLKLSARYHFRYLPGSAVRYRVLPTSLSHSPAGRAAMDESRIRILASWLGRIDGAAERVVADRLWQAGTVQLMAGEDDAARRTLALAAGAGRRRGRRVLAAVARLPGGCTASRTALSLGRRVRRS